MFGKRISSAALLAAVALACVACERTDQDKAGGPPDTTRLIGTVTYHEKAAPPPDAPVEVRLEETSKGAPSTTIDGTTFGAAGRQVPLPFTLEFNRDLLKSEHTYALAATISSKSGDVLYASADDEAKLLNPNTTARIELVVHPVSSS